MPCRPPGHRPPEDHLPELQQALLAWFDANARPLPWRRHYTPYEVWISEIMLQQTQMERGVNYFLRWMERFPDLPALAAASEEEVLHAWEGLGYYSRARNLLAAARLVMQEHGGVFPSDPEAIRALPGIGPYTTAAIASIAFNLPWPVSMPMWNGSSPRLRCGQSGQIRPGRRAHRGAGPPYPARRRGPPPQPGHDGAGRPGLRQEAPLRPVSSGRFCTALHLGIVHERPVPGQKGGDHSHRGGEPGVLSSHDRVFVQKRLPQGAWGGLWEFPGGRVEPGETPEQAVVREFAEERASPSG